MFPTLLYFPLEASTNDKVVNPRIQRVEEQGGRGRGDKEE
jgi:hypothetical protein